MASEISSKAEISPKAKIGNNCKIFPFVYIEDDVEIGDNCIIFPFVSICDGSRIGKNNKIHQGSVIAALPQDFNFRGEKSYVQIGDNNVIRENVVINRGTHRDGVTKIGNNNFLLEGVHISHDTVVGDYCVFGYGVKVAGDCEIHNGVIFSSSAIQNANTRVGRLAMVQAGTSFSQDIPPFVIAGGKPLEYGGPNNTMVRRACLMSSTRSRSRCPTVLRYRPSSSSSKIRNEALCVSKRLILAQPSGDYC